ncbi:putative ATP-dependent RNA helicase TDRD12 [Carassius auratus]|uniref:RNA helicase n=1 Tax=Carassius auratus TaxID=7957 RepID=A0A6P6MFP6_CARAU|nr:putative ATP-dependent RNA helicase TDRD12 [Carassius auratus]XP_026095351.1 putative ATP-dependent RNA helicase TDRD12 [Carassius auratus]XP_026095353.1 putative ATP-dependent RNA helicase TDRD12 [Carassius auratus]XP_026095354.1 putative ATP-dependent RNA helicase TDRD12 [Carassius auratus]XP_026095355.1 putative ATP-dependent RNA helicase TDRD12 [Carassius auratus]
MLEIQIIKIEDPGCLWARVLKGPGIQPDSPEDYENLRVKMNLFYHDVDLDVQKLKPAELKEGLVCVVFSLDLKSWCRAVVESVFQGTGDTQAWCLLLDHGDRIIVRADDVRSPLERFLQLPFRVRRFKLAGIRPMTLQVPISENTAELVPSSTWDSSATKYLHNLLQVSTLVEAVLCETQLGCSAIELYLTINETKICVNDELVAKKFACFMREESSALEGNRNGDRTPISLAWDIYSSPHQLLEMKGRCPIKPPPPDIPIGKERKDAPHTEIDEVSHSEKQKPQVSEEAHTPRRAPKLMRNAGTDTIGRGWRIRAEATDIFSDECCGQTRMHKPQYMFDTLSHSKQIPQPDQTDNNSIAPTPAASSPSCASDSSEEQKVAALSQEPSLEDQLTSSRLMQFLNPDPLNPDQESLDAKVERCNPGHLGVIVHSALRVEPCRTLTRAPISEQFRKFLLWRKYNGPNVAESYCWPSVARGFDTVLVSHSGDNPLSYIPPLLMLLQTVSVVSSLAARNGPIAVILCPGWEKVQTVLELLEDSKATYNLHPTSVLLGVDQEEPKKFKIQRNCQLLVTTPFTMMRLLDAQCFLFLRLCHLVLDEADVLYSQAPEQMSVILKHFQKVVSGEERSSCPRQIIAVGSRWSAGIEALVREHMIYPSVIITVMEEAALYGRVHQRVQLCLDCDKISVLLGSLDFHPPKPQKTLIITNSAEETEHVYKAVVNTAVFTLKAHEDVTDQFDFVIDQWRKDISRGTQVILVTTNDCLKALGIRDATCVVHYGFPSSPKLFGSRLFCMSEHFRNLSDMDHAESSSPAAQSVWLLSELNARHVCGVLRYLRRSGALLPPELLTFALGVQQAKEEQKTDRPLCSSLKSFGFCRDSTVCPDRHMINKALDQPKHPDSGNIMVLPLCIKSANVYSGRIVSQKEDRYETLAAEMNAHYASERLCAVQVLKGELYAIQEENIYNRVRVTELPEKGEQLFSSVTACFIDEGRTQEVKSHQLLQLPPRFQAVPDQAVEIILCRAQPVDGEVDWNPKVTRAISQKIRGKLHQARVVMSVGNTVWVDPMVRMTRVPGLKTYINEYNVHAEILASGFGVNNPQHVDLLKSVFQGDENAVMLQHLTDDRFESPSSSSQQRADVLEDALTSKMKELVSSHNAVMEFSQTPISPQNNSAVQCNGHLKDRNDDDSSEGSGDIMSPDPNGFSSPNPTRPASSETDGDEALNIDKLQAVNEPQNIHNPAAFLFQPTGFHPQIKWFQRAELVTVYIKLISPVMQKCEFLSDAVIYSGYVNDRHYYTKLELSGDILAEESSWEMRCNEPVIKLKKKEKRDWSSLLKHKSPFVSYEFDHIDETRVSSVNGHLFLAEVGEEGCYVSSESDSDSD